MEVDKNGNKLGFWGNLFHSWLSLKCTVLVKTI